MPVGIADGVVLANNLHASVEFLLSPIESLARDLSAMDRLTLFFERILERFSRSGH